MCLGVPGKVVSVTGEEPLSRMGKVSFGGIVREVCLAGVPDADVGEYVIVHAGFAIARLDEDAANEVFDCLTELNAAIEEEAR